MGVTPGDVVAKIARFSGDIRLVRPEMIKQPNIRLSGETQVGFLHAVLRGIVLSEHQVRMLSRRMNIDGFVTKLFKPQVFKARQLIDFIECPPLVRASRPIADVAIAPRTIAQLGNSCAGIMVCQYGRVIRRWLCPGTRSRNKNLAGIPEPVIGPVQHRLDISKSTMIDG